VGCGAQQNKLMFRSRYTVAAMGVGGGSRKGKKPPSWILQSYI